MAAIGKDNRSVGGVPDLRQLIRAASDDTPTSWRPTRRLDWPLVSGKVDDGVRLNGIPYLGRPVAAGGDDLRAVGRPRHTVHRLRVIAINDGVASGHGVDD